VGAFIIQKEGYQLSTEDVRDFCKAHIAKYKIPRYVFFVDAFPMTGSGKIQKFRLREMALELCKKEGIEIR
jgi:fatty-acyl-CoA synthase